MTALYESLLLTIIHDVYSVLILTYLNFGWVRKPILDSLMHQCMIPILCLEGKDVS